MGLRRKENSLAFKVGLGFGLVGLVLIGAVLITIWQVQQVEKRTTQLIELRSPATAAGMQLLDGLNASTIALQNWLLTGDERYKDERDIAWSNSIQPSLTKLNQLSAQWTNSNNLERLNQITAELGRLKKAQDKIEALQLTNASKPQIREILNNQSVPASANIKTQLTEIVASQRDRVMGGIQEFKQQIDQLLYTDWALLIIGVILCSMLALILTKSLTKPVYRLVEIAKSLAKGDLDQEINITETSEFEQLSAALTEMVHTFQDIAKVTERMAMGDYSHRVNIKSEDDRLAITVNQMLENFTQIVDQANAIAEGDYSSDVKPRSDADTLGNALQNMTVTLRNNKTHNDEQNWLKDGLAQLAAELTDTRDLPTLCNRAISTITRYLDAGTGAIYVYDAEPEALKLLGSYAYTERDALASEFNIGEGIIGQVALEKQAILLKNVKPNDCVITTGTSQTTPSSIYAIPIIDEDVLIGVMEIAATTQINQLQMLYIEQLTPILANQIQTLQQQTLTEKLYSESKLLTEKLQAQQEELRAANEELEQQTQILKASEEELRLKDEQQRAINTKLEERTKELETQKSEIESKNIAINKARDELEAKAQELERASQYKSEFLANMSHELRTPLNSLLILAKLFADNVDDNLSEDQVESAQIMLKSGQDLLTLINDILDLAKVEAGKIELNIHETMIQEFLKSADINFSHVAEDKHISFVTELGENVPEMMYTDDHRVSQIIRNLISNAIKFTEVGEVRFKICRPPENKVFKRNSLTPESTIAFIVSDTGIGIPEEKQKLVFESFQQADGTTSRQYGGTGLGLSISTELANLLGGEIDLESEAGKGSKFILYLPVKDGDASYSPPPIENTETIVSQNSPKPSTAKSVEASIIPDDRKEINADDKSLLIVEDDPQFTKILLTICRKKGYKCLHAADGESGLLLAETYNPSGILLDISLPGMDGLSMLDKLKSQAQTSNIPVHIISAVDKCSTAIKKGAIGYLTKPVSRDQLETAINKIQGVEQSTIKDLLIIEDDTSQLDAMKKLLNSNEVNITGVTTGEEALTLLNQQKFDCIILDLGLPDMSGQELLERYHANCGDHHPSIIIHTGKTLSADESERLNQYVDSIIIKGGAASADRLAEETHLFLHRIEAELPDLAEEKPRTQHNPETVIEGKTVLVVDDDMRNTFALAKTLKSKGLNIVMAANGEKGIESLEQNPDIDIVLMDIMMPVMDGYEAMTEIRKRKEFEQLPIIALTAKAMSDDREKCIQAGASDFLSKPLDIDKLISMLRAWL